MPKSRRKTSRDSLRRVGSNATVGANEAAIRTFEWRWHKRAHALGLVAQRTQELRWSPRVLQALLEELWIGKEFDLLVGPPRSLSTRRYPQAVAVALALRHSWRRDDLRWILRRLGISTRGI